VTGSRPTAVTAGGWPGCTGLGSWSPSASPPGPRRRCGTCAAPGATWSRTARGSAIASASSCCATGRSGATARPGRSRMSGGCSPNGSPSRRWETTYDHDRAVLQRRDAQLEAIQADLAVWQDRAPFADQVARLAAYRGVTRLGGLHLAAEVGDWRRFARARAFMGFCGLVPSEYSSGPVTRRGHLTKAGNLHLRTQLAWVGLGLPAPPQRRRPAGEPSAGPGPSGAGSSVGRPAATVWALPTPGRPQALDQHRRRCHRPGAGRVPVGRDDGVTTMPTTDSRSAEEANSIVTTRRGTAIAGPIPVSTMPSGLAEDDPSQGPLPADRRPAVPTRIHQSGGLPIHAAPVSPAPEAERG
jgi:hypothetical protein